MIFNADKLIRMIKDAPNGSEMKIFFYITFNQPNEGIRGFRSTKEQLAIDLKLNLATIFRSLKWLKDNLLIQELKMAEDFDFMVNPYFISNNSDFDERIAEWNRRCNLDAMKEVERRRKKRLKLLKNSS